MKVCGKVLFADVFLDSHGRSKGCGIVEFSTREEALDAIETLSDTKIGDTDRMIFVREDRETKSAPRAEFNRTETNRPARRGGYGGRGRDGVRSVPSTGAHGRQIIVKNLPYTTTWQDLKDYFREAGKIIRADILINDDGRNKGQGIIVFDTQEDAQRSIELFNKTNFQGRQILVQEDKYV